MKVKIGNEIFDSNNKPIMLILDETDKKNIANMDEDKFKFISYPKEMPIEDVRKWIDDEPSSIIKDDRMWNRSFEKDSFVMLDENFMSEVEKRIYKQFTGKIGTVLECNADMHCIHGSYCSHTIQWPGGKITGHGYPCDYDEETHVPVIPPTWILEDFHVKYLRDLSDAFPGHEIKFAIGERILFDGEIVKGILCDPPRIPYNDNLKAVIEEIKRQFKI